MHAADNRNHNNNVMLDLGCCEPFMRTLPGWPESWTETGSGPSSPAPAAIQTRGHEAFIHLKAVCPSAQAGPSRVELWEITAPNTF